MPRMSALTRCGHSIAMQRYPKPPQVGRRAEVFCAQDERQRCTDWSSFADARLTAFDLETQHHQPKAGFLLLEEFYKGA